MVAGNAELTDKNKRRNKLFKQIQHGDVLLRRVSRLPAGVIPVDRKDGVLVIMDGELTGHKHTVAEKEANLWEFDGELYIESTAPVTIKHEEHKSLEIPPGIYQIGQVKEYDYFQEMERRAAD